MITQMAFMTPAELQEVKDTLETWSGLCAEYLAEMDNRRKSALQINTSPKR